MDTEKALIRKEVLFRRDSLTEKLKIGKQIKIKETLLTLPEFKDARIILFYASFRSEVDTFDLIKYCFIKGKLIALPKVDREHDKLTLYEIKNMDEVLKGYCGIPEPAVSECRKKHISEIDLAIVPGVAFDEQCNRLGYGKGFYDKLLGGAKIKTIGLAYEEQIVKSIPSQRHDIKMNKIITDKRIIECHGH